MSKPDILLISTADWDNPYWTNKQHVAVQLARMGYRILYIESQGLRRPTATGRDIGRAWKKTKRALRPPRRVAENIWVASPLVIPFQGFSIVRKVNKIILTLSLAFFSLWTRIKPSIVWTYSPMTTELYNVEHYKLLVYHAVDDIKTQPGMPAQEIDNAEKKLVDRADIIFTTSLHLQNIHREMNENTFYFPNVADFDHFNKALENGLNVPSDIKAMSKPIIGFIGAISGYKVDFDLIEKIASARPDWSIVMIGEVGEGDPWTNVENIKKYGNVHFLGGRPYIDLPAYLKCFDVAILPSRINDYTRSMFPMKFFEYLASGRQVVSTPLPALVDYSDVAYFCADADSFIKSIDDILKTGGKDMENGIRAAKEQTYEERTKKMMNVIFSIIK